jgi:hypothetical protein
MISVADRRKRMTLFWRFKENYSLLHSFVANRSKGSNNALSEPVRTDRQRPDT